MSATPVSQSKHDELKRIWEGDQLDRRFEAQKIERYLIAETASFRRLGRFSSIVLGIDAPYGRGKTWFLDRLGHQLALSHPVARIDAWADDAEGEPLTAFMSAIDEALAPYLCKSKSFSDRMALAKAAALPVMGKLFAGAAIKALSKVAGDEIDAEVGDAIEEAVLGAKELALASGGDRREGATAQALEAAFQKLNKEIDSLVDRRGAAMLAAYHQRKQSRELFRRNMRDLVAAIDGTKGPGTGPLIVIVDELDRCRPDYALKMLEEIKHFFDVPGVVFVVGFHGGQLSKSVKAVYGSEFESDEYLRRFFTRRYQLKANPIVELTAALFDQIGIDQDKLRFPNPIVQDGYPLNNSRIAGLILAQWLLSPREVVAVVDAMRLFVESWEYPDPIEPVFLLSILVHLVRGEALDTAAGIQSTGLVRFPGKSVQGSHVSSAPFTPNDLLGAISPLAWTTFDALGRQGRSANAAINYVLDWLADEYNARSARREKLHQSHLVEYIPRVHDIACFVEEVNEMPNPE